MKQPQQFSPYFIAKCYAAYYNSPAYMDGKTTGVLGVMLDDIIHFGPNGWKLKLWPVNKIQPEHAQRILEMRSGINLAGCRIDVTDIPLEGYVVMTANMNNVHIASENLYYRNKPLFSNEESAYFRGFHYDIGFSYLHSLIEADLAVDASLLNEGPFWAQAQAPLTFRQEYINGLQLLAHQSPEHIGILNALIGAELGKNTLELFHGMSDIIHKLRRDSDEENKRINN
jgi:hypothetical protein